MTDEENKAQDPGTNQTQAPLEQVNRELQEKSTLKRAQELKIPYVNIAKTPLNPDFLKVLEIDEAKRGRIIPFFKVAKKIRVALENPENPETKSIIEKLQKEGYEILINLASSSGIDEAMQTYDSSQSYKKIEIVKDVEAESIQTYEQEIKELADLPKKLETLTAEQALNLLNVSAMKTGASDIHFEPEEEVTVVRFRIDGVLNKVFDLKPEVYSNISSQIKYESKMRLNVYTIPQDGRYTFVFNKKIIGVRVSSIPTPNGESFVCRFLVGGEKQITFKELGFQGHAYAKLQTASSISQGMILVTGPTGSGKSTTLYALVNEMNNPENKIITLEDPVEYHLAGVTQSQIDEKNEYTFAGGLRTVLRQDPDVIMLGEIRDLDTAQTASQAALTGHVVLSTLHTNSAIETIPRLVNMGLPPFMVAPALHTIIAQRLVRKVCPDCVKQVPITESEKKEFEIVMGNLENVNKAAVVAIPESLPKSGGCELCSHTGYRGRLVVTELITMTSELKDLVLNEASSIKMIVAARKEGMITMREDGFLKVAQGLTTLDEVYRVTNII